MKTNELRIGNFVATDNENTPLRIESIEDRENNLFYVKTSTIEGFVGRKGLLPISVLKGIELTEEWLFKLGFQIRTEKNGNGYFLPGLTFFAIVKKNGNSFYNMKNMNDAGDITFTRHIEYVHQLQNMYFELSEKELKLN